MPALWWGDKGVRVYLAGTYSRPKIAEHPFTIPYMLESFYYVEPWQMEYRSRKGFGSFMLDSGAYTYMTGTGGAIDFVDYVHRYAAYINRHKIDLFFEMDVDKVIGYGEVKKLTRILERLTAKPCIPVWHRTRGQADYKRMCEKYDYVALGGIVTGEFRKPDHPYFTPLINMAHKSRAEIHGLGYTPLQKDSLYHFDSVDSKSWLSGSLGNTLFEFTGSGLRMHRGRDNQRRAHYTVMDKQNLAAWVQYALYMDRGPV